jgi:hypothetical protein
LSQPDVATNRWQNGKTEQMNNQRLSGKLTIASSLVGLAFGFLLLGILILSNQSSEGTSIVPGAIGILLGAMFFMSAFFYWRNETLES